MSVLDFLDFIVILFICIERMDISKIGFHYKRKPIYVHFGCIYLLTRYLLSSISQYNAGLISIDFMFMFNSVAVFACMLFLILNTSFKDNKVRQVICFVCQVICWSCLLANFGKYIMM